MTRQEQRRRTRYTSGKRAAGQQGKEQEFSKRLIDDTRRLLWIVTLGGLALAGWCVHKGFDASLPWLSAMVGLPWTAHGAVCSFYLTMAKSDHREGGITFEAAKASNFGTQDPDSDLPAG